MALQEGTRVFVCYDLPPPALWHERFILARCACGQGYHIVLTPDRDVYPEQISLENSDLAGFRIGVGNALPYGLDQTNTYRIRDLPVGGEMAQFRMDARHAANAMAVIPGVRVAQAGGVIAGPLAQPGAVAGEDEGSKWLVVETEGGRVRGDAVTLDGSEVIHGNIGLKAHEGKFYAIRQVASAEISKYAGKEAAADARLLGVTFQEKSRIERLWRDVAGEMTQETFEDWNVPGPRTAHWCSQFLNRRNGGPTEHHRYWVSHNGLTADMWGVVEHENLMKMLDKMGRFDGLDLSNLTCAELAFRRLQLIEYFYSDKGPGSGKGSGKNKEKDKKHEDLSYKAEAAIFTGTHREYGDLMVAPDLLEYVSKEVERDAAVLKQVRKAREERAAASK